MARMHARRRGKSGSTRPVTDGTPEWVAILPREVETKVVELAREGVQPAVIGIRLRDSFGVPSIKQLTGKSISTIIEEAGLSPNVPQDLKNLINRAINLNEHLQSNRKDIHNRRGLELIEARIRRLAKYYKDTGALAADWKYTRQGARLLVD
ncbi:MAG: 30S ribosomal protein S15 [Thermoplasmatota archaeon]